jgi:hypothetical protein
MVVGSMNLTGAGLYRNTEGSLYVLTLSNGAEALRLQAWFESIWAESDPIDGLTAATLVDTLHSQLTAAQAVEVDARQALQQFRESLRPTWRFSSRLVQQLGLVELSDQLEASYLDEFLASYSARELVSEWENRWSDWYQWFQDRREQVGELVKNRRELVERRLYVSETTPMHRKRLIQLDEKGYLAVAIQTLYRYRDPNRVDEVIARLQEKAPGVGMATGTEILHFCWPDQYAIYNKRSGVGLGLLFNRPGLFFSGTSTVQDYSFFRSYAGAALSQLVQAMQIEWAHATEAAEMDEWLGTRPWLVLDHFLEWIWINYA